MNDADYTRLAMSGAVGTYMQHKRRRERRIKLALTIIITLAAVAAVAYALPG